MMPYHVEQTAQCPAAQPWGVIKDSDGTVMGCHPTKADADEQMAALYASEPGVASMNAPAYLTGPGLIAQAAQARGRGGDAETARELLAAVVGSLDREMRADVDNSAWDAAQAWANGAASDDPAAFYGGICAGRKAGDPATQAAHALPHHYHPADPPNAAGTANALSRLPQTQGLTNAAAARSHLEAHMRVINPDYEPSAASAPGVHLWPDGPLVLGAKPAAQARSAAFGGDRRAFSPELARLDGFRAHWRHQPVRLNGKEFQQLDGYASVVEIEYEMWDFWGPYTEKVAAGAFDATLAAEPDVTFLVNHKGLSMARTKAPPGMDPTLVLDADPRGLHSLAYLNPERGDVRDLLIAIDDKNVTEMSFAFMIDDGRWDEGFESFTITRVDIDRGDVSAVNYGANPYTSITARSREIVTALDQLPAGAQRAAFGRLATILGGGPEALTALTRSARAVAEGQPGGRAVSYYEALLAIDEP